MNKTIFLGLIILFFYIPIAAQKAVEQSKTEQLEEVVVTDSRFPLKRVHSGKTVIKITAGELEKNQGKTLAEVINTKSGIEINGSRSNAGQNLSYFVRGGNNRQVLFLIDGVQVSDPSQIANDFDLRLLSLSEIESIEIIKGASSTLYGSGAATAVISITTKKSGEDTISATFRSSIGTNRSQKAKNNILADFSNSVSVNGKSGKFSYLTSFGNQYVDGLSAIVSPANESDPFSRINTTVKLGYALSNSFSIHLYGNQSKYKAAFDNVFPAEDANFTSRSEQYRAGISSVFSYTKGNLTLNAAYNSIDRVFNDNFSSVFEAKSRVFENR
ncbi:MAG: TonB-dependent receptor plug domain-containing protein [Bacteroidota bacterium]